MIQIILKENGLELDAPTIGFSLNYTIDDIRDPESKDSSYSKSITLPGSKRNDKILGQLYDISSSFVFFNPNAKTDAVMLVNDVVVMDGFFQLKAINRDTKYDQESNSHEYEIVMFESVINFFTEVGDSDLSELDYSDTTHDWTRTNIVNAWTTNTWTDGYQYPMMYNSDQNAQWAMIQFQPSIYHKYLLDKIITHHGFTASGSFWDSHSDYEKELITMRTGKLEKTDIEIEEERFDVGWAADDNISSISWTDPSSWGGDSNVSRFLIVDGDLVATDDSTSPHKNTNGNDFDTTLGTWTVGVQGSYSLGAVIPWEMSFTNTDATSPVFLYTQTTVAAVQGLPLSAYGREINFVVKAYKGSTLLGTISTFSKPATPANIVPGGGFANTPAIAAGGTVTKNGICDGTFFTNELLMVGDVISFEYEYSITDNLSGASTFFYFKTPSNTVSDSDYTDPNESATKTYVPITISTSVKNVASGGTRDRIYNTPSSKTVEGDSITVGTFVIEDFKQKDLIIDLTKRYNLYISIDPDNATNLIFQTRDDFYAEETQVLDWTYLKDRDQKDSIELLSELQNKEMLFTYSESDDQWNENYTKSTGDIFGQKKKSLLNDFAQGETTIESPFNMAVNLYNHKDSLTTLPLSRDVSRNGDINEDIEEATLSYWGGLIPTIDSKLWKLQSFLDGSNPTYSTFPYAGHYDNPYLPFLDICYGEVAFEYHNENTQIPENNLYNSYWQNYINQIPEGRLFSAYFYLTEKDISDVKNNLGTKIIVDNQHYYINKISDYDPTKTQTTKVELLLISDFKTFIPGTNNVGARISNDVIAEFDPKGYIIKGSTNKSLSRDVLILGEENNISDSSNQTAIFGTNSTIESGVSNSFIFGDNSTIKYDSSNTIILGNNITATDDNTIYLNEILINNDGIFTYGTNGIINPLSPYEFEDDVNIENSIVPTTGDNIISSTGTVQDFSNILGGESNSIINQDHSTIVGGENNDMGSGGQCVILSGVGNLIDAPSGVPSTGTINAILSGRYNNILDSSGSVIVSGQSHSIYNVSKFSSIITGILNSIDSSENSTITGGKSNKIIDAADSVISGGNSNTNKADESFIAGGSNLNINQYSPNSTIIGGASCIIRGVSPNSTIIGGQYMSINSSSGYSSIIGGSYHWIETYSTRSSIIGGSRQSIRSYSTRSSIIGGFELKIQQSTNSTILGGRYNNCSTSGNSAIIGGENNTIDSSEISTISGGQNNTIIRGEGFYVGSDYSFIGGGKTNSISYGKVSSIVGGGYNSIYSEENKPGYSFIGGGKYNTLTQTGYSFIGTGHTNTVGDCNYSTIIGGQNNTINSFDNVHILGSNLTADAADTTFVNNLNIEGGLIFSGTSGGGVNNLTYDQITTDTTLATPLHNVYLVDGSSVNTITLNLTQGQVLTIKNISTSKFDIATTTGNIDGLASNRQVSKYESYEIFFDGTDYWVI